MKDEPRPVPVHELEHPEPVVIHHAEEDDSTALARWLRRGLEKGPVFWIFLGGAALAVAALATLASGLAASRTVDPQAWVELMTARTAEDSLKVADAHPDTTLALNARLHAANLEYDSGFDALSNPAQRDLAGPRLKKALDLYRQVASAADAKSPQAPIAAYGIARTLEARNELPEAIKQYRLVASTYPGTTEAKRSEAMAKALEDPEAVQFYKELYAYKPPATPAPADGAVPPPLIPGMNPGLGTPPALDPTKSFLPDLKGAGPADIDPPPVSPTPTPAPAPETAPAEPQGKAELPNDPKGKAELPNDPFLAPPPK
ncbi:tetratricopeptide repeat protein [Tundrisphaera sp. TA3]|uniref:tetratricopeptide repeat protein n=1 Tax=Tundrisphaera sp. TA3 TaxID=3435775 RepID=UPI003EB6EAA5